MRDEGVSYYKASYALQSFPYENPYKCYKILTSRLWPVLFTFISFFYSYTLLFCSKIKSCSDRCFPQQGRTQTTLFNYIYYETVLNKLSFNYYCFTQSETNYVVNMFDV